MEFRGIYDHGLIRPSEPVNFPDGTEVEFQPVLNGRHGAAVPSTGVEELERLSHAARSNPTLEQILNEQSVRPLRSMDDLVIEGLEDEDVDGFLSLVREGRR